MNPTHRADCLRCEQRCGSAVCAARIDKAHETRFDARQVARITEALRRGDFQLDADAIAARLLALRLLPGRPLN